MRRRWKEFFLYSIATIIVIVWLVPFFYILMTAVKPNKEFYMYGVFSLPHTIAWSNFAKAWDKINIYFGNSAVITVISVPLLLLVATLAAYPLARMKFRLNNAFTLVFLVGFMLPVHVTIFPLFNLFKKLNLLNSYYSLILTNIAFGLPFTIYLIRGYFAEIPKDIEEAARIDGCGSFRIYTSIILPLGKPALLVATVLNFMGVWNEFFFAKTFIQDTKRMPVQAGLQSFVEQWSQSYNLMTAGMLISILPVFILFILFSKYLVAGMAEGAVKG